MDWKRLATALIAFGLALGMGPIFPAHAQDEGWLIAQVNSLRAGLGLGGVAPNGALNAAAAQHSAYMATTCDISHTEADGSTPVSRARANGYGGHVNENIYGGSNAQAANAWSFWVNSGPHYMPMVDSAVNEIGIGIASGPCGHFFTMLLGSGGGAPAPPPPPAPDLPAAAPAEASAPQPASGPAPAQEAAAPTQRPYVPPAPDRSPTPTIPTLTPSATWTLTPTHTPSPTGTQQPPTSTPIMLPTVAAPGQQSTTVAIAASPTEAPPTATSTVPPVPTEPPPAQQQAVVGGGFAVRDLLPFALLGQIVLIGLAGYAYFRQQRP